MMVLTGIVITTTSLLVIAGIFGYIRDGRPETERPIHRRNTMTRGLA